MKKEMCEPPPLVAPPPLPATASDSVHALDGPAASEGAEAVSAGLCASSGHDTSAAQPALVSSAPVPTPMQGPVPVTMQDVPAASQKTSPDAPFGPNTKASSCVQDPQRHVESLEEAFGFGDFCLDVLAYQRNAGDAQEMLEALAASLEADSMSTAYSGVCAPETALNVWRFRVGQRLGRSLAPPKCRLGHMIEWNGESQAECLLHAKETDSCVFGDISEFWRDELKKQVIPELLRKPEMAMQVLMPLVLQGNAVKLHGYCLAHKKITCRLNTCKRHMAGTSCKGFSRRGVLFVCTVHSAHRANRLTDKYK